jgi:hypothetical protein
MGKNANSGASRSGGSVMGLGIAVLLVTGLVAGFV